jgi:hypothetical protein
MILDWWDGTERKRYQIEIMIRNWDFNTGILCLSSVPPEKFQEFLEICQKTVPFPYTSSHFNQHEITIKPGTNLFINVVPEQ